MKFENLDFIVVWSLSIKFYSIKKAAAVKQKAFKNTQVQQVYCDAHSKYDISSVHLKCVWNVL